jgi:hypothetical protein
VGLKHAACGFYTSCIRGNIGWGGKSCVLLFAISVTVSVNAKKYGGLWAQPIGSGIAMRGGALGELSLGMTTARLRAAIG